MITVLATAAASWAALMALAPLLQIRRMWQRQSSDDVSVGYLPILLPGFLAFGVGCAAVAYALRLRTRHRARAPRRTRR